MSIASQISRLQSAKTAIRNAIIAKGVTVPAESEYVGGRLTDYADYIAQIPSSAGAFKTGRFTLTSQVTSTYTIVTRADLGFPVDTYFSNGAPFVFALKVITTPSTDSYTFHAATMIATSYDTGIKSVLRTNGTSKIASAVSALLATSNTMYLKITSTAVQFVASSACILKPGTYEWYAIPREAAT